jgi:hypothetical protein
VEIEEESRQEKYISIELERVEEFFFLVQLLSFPKSFFV